MIRRTNAEKELRTIELYREISSISVVAEQLSISLSTVHRILVRNNEPRRNVGHPLVYPKTDFSGNPAEQARILGFIEDCWVGPNGKQIHLHTSTTHFAQIRLFSGLFAGYGHASLTPSYHKHYSYYQWHIWVYLNNSFAFATEYKRNPMKFLSEIDENGYVYIYVGSLTDAEGHVGIDANDGYPLANLSITNNSRQLLEWTQSTLGGDIYRNHDSYQLVLRGVRAVEALRKLPITHEEKVAAKELILYYADNGGIGAEALRAYEELRRKIDEEVRLCSLQARLEFIRRKGRPHKDDPDQR